MKGLLVLALFLLLAGGAFAAPIITVDKNVSICNKNKCENASTVRQGLLNMPAPMTQGIRSIHVMDKLPPKGERVPYEARVDGRLRIYARGMNTSTYRAAVMESVSAYYASESQFAAQWEEEQASRKYPLPSWAPRPGQCDLGVRMTNSAGNIVCVRHRYSGQR